MHRDASAGTRVRVSRIVFVLGLAVLAAGPLPASAADGTEARVGAGLVLFVLFGLPTLGVAGSWIWERRESLLRGDWPLRLVEHPRQIWEPAERPLAQGHEGPSEAQTPYRSVGAPEAAAGVADAEPPRIGRSDRAIEVFKVLMDRVEAISSKLNDVRGHAYSAQAAAERLEREVRESARAPLLRSLTQLHDQAFREVLRCGVAGEAVSDFTEDILAFIEEGLLMGGVVVRRVEEGETYDRAVMKVMERRATEDPGADRTVAAAHSCAYLDEKGAKTLEKATITIWRCEA